MFDASHPCGVVSLVVTRAQRFEVEMLGSVGERNFEIVWNEGPWHHAGTLSADLRRTSQKTTTAVLITPHTIPAIIVRMMIL